MLWIFETSFWNSTLEQFLRYGGKPCLAFNIYAWILQISLTPKGFWLILKSNLLANWLYIWMCQGFCWSKWHWSNNRIEVNWWLSNWYWLWDMSEVFYFSFNIVVQIAQHDYFMAILFHHEALLYFSYLIINK